jgi:hypothetical protein
MYEEEARKEKRTTTDQLQKTKFKTVFLYNVP